MVVARLLRLCGHGEHDDAQYVSASLKASAVGRDCLKVAEARILKEGWAAAPALAQWRRNALDQVEETVAKVQRELAPDADYEDWRALSSEHLMEGNS